MDWLLARTEVRTGEAHPRRERDETEQGKAARMLHQEMKRLGWTKAELERRRKGDPAKVALAVDCAVRRR